MAAIGVGGLQRRICAWCSWPLEGSRAGAGLGCAVCAAAGVAVAAAVAEADHVGPELHALLRHGEVGEVGEVGSGGRWKLRTCVFLEYCDAPLRLASGLWQAKRMCLCPS